MGNFEAFIKTPAKWNEFLEYKLSGDHISESEKITLVNFVKNKLYMKEVDEFLHGVPFPSPTLKNINKHNNKKKREVFIFPENKNIFLKFVSFYLMNYDSIFSENLCSFRKNICVKTAVKRLINTPDISDKYLYKVDISDYFNSVNTEILLPQLKTVLKDDGLLYSFIEKLLLDPLAEKDGKLIEVKKGIMAGMPISAFLANLYLSEMDKYFEMKKVVYIRYSDDIIIFARNPEEISLLKKYILQFFENRGLVVNTSKEVYGQPGEKWEFLGFSYCNNVVDISKTALNKMKKKMKRKAKAIVRWKDRKKADNNRAIRAFIRTFNKKFFSVSANNDITWTRWYFPVINTAESLHMLDIYMQDCIRYIAKGNYSKSRFDLRYADMKKLGYISLVNEFYSFKAKK